MPKGQRVKLKRDVSSERVLEVAARLFRDQGYSATTVREIAQAAEMKSASLYYHYPSKEALLEAVMNLAITSLIEEVSEALARKPPTAAFRDRLSTAMQAHLAAIHRRADLVIASRQSLNLLPEPWRAEHLRLRQAYARIWRDLIDAGKTSGEVGAEVDVVVLEMMILGALNWTSEWWDPGRITMARLSEVMMQIVVDGVSGADPGGVAARKARAP